MDRVHRDRVPRTGEAFMAGMFAAALSAGAVILGLALLIVAGATFFLGMFNNLGDARGTASFPGMTSWLIVVTVIGAAHCLTLWALLRALHVDHPATVAVITTIGLSIAVVIWWKLGPGAAHHRFGIPSALFMLPPVTFVLSAVSTLLTNRTTPPEPTLTPRSTRRVAS